MKGYSSAAIFLALVLLAVQSEAQGQRCMHFTNFCDSITLQKSGDLAYGGWDWQCGGDWYSVNVIGSMKNPPELATRPLDDDFPSPYTLQLSFKPGKVFDLYAGYGLGYGQVILTFRANEPYTITDGACGLSDAERSRPRMMSNISPVAAVGAENQATPRCMHFKNFCDTIVFSIYGELASGDWDWQCKGDWRTSFIMGNAKAGQELATRPWLSEYYLAPYSMQFQFKPGDLFDLYGTTGIGHGVFTARSNEPFTISNDSCSLGDVDTSQPRLMAH